MATANRIFLIIAASWMSAIGGGVFTPKSRAELQNSVSCLNRNGPTTNGPRGSTLGGMDIRIQYCGGWGYGRKARRLKRELEEAFDGKISVREIKDPSVTGNFEVIVNGEVIWSKKRGQGFPTTKDRVKTIVDTIRAKQRGLSPTTTIPRLDIHIQYCGGWGYARKSHRLKGELEEAFENKIFIKEIRDPGVTGNFEVTVSGALVWSKSKGHGFPTTKERIEMICAAIRARQRGLSPTTTVARMDIHIRYCGGWGYGPKSHQLKKDLEEAFDGQISVREIKDPGVTENFEVVVNGEVVWSKKRGQGFPTTKENVETICASIRAKQDGGA